MAGVEVCETFCGKPMINGSSTPAQLGRGNIKTDKNNLKEFTILLVGTWSLNRLAIFADTNFDVR